MFRDSCPYNSNAIYDVNSTAICKDISAAITVATVKKRRELSDKEQKRAADRLFTIWNQKKDELGLTQEKAAFLLGWKTQAAVQQYLSGYIPLNLKALLKFSKLLAVNPEDIYPELTKLINVMPGTTFTNNGQSGPQVEGARHIAQHPVRKIKILNYIQAGSPREVVDQYEPGGGMEIITVDEELATELGPHAYALIIEGDSMLAEFKPGDLVIIDPDVRPNPGDFVVAKMDAYQDATFKKYRPRGQDKDNGEVFELVPLNVDYPTITVNSDNPGRVIGTMVEHRRRRRHS